ncbi:MAG: SPOR domain-containing protein [Candidatus Marinimicrobia bacterium]|nr:SPOR domain-containing protein [Candidatus Neomarinimicrobiota bacterium]
METKYFKICLSIIIVAIVTTGLYSNEVDEVLKGKNSIRLRMSMENMPDSFQKKAIETLLEENGDKAILQADKIISDSSNSRYSAYLKIMIADYYLLDDNFVSAMVELNDAESILPNIVDTRYYQLIENRIIGSLEKTDPNTNPTKETFFDFDDKYLEKESEKNLNLYSNENYHIQVGVFSQLDNAKKIADFFTSNNYSVKIRNSHSGTLYIVIVGNYNSYDNALNELDIIKNKLGRNGMVIKDKR